MNLPHAGKNIFRRAGSDMSTEALLARNGDVELALDVEGVGPDLLLIVGSASTRPLWDLVRPLFAQSFRTIAFDLRETGASSESPDPYSLHDLAADAIAVLDAAGSTRAHVLGHSMGGAIAQELALAYPERCASLTLACTWGRGDGYTRSLMELLAALSVELPGDRTLLAAILFAGGTVEGLRATGLFERTDLAMSLGPLPTRAALARQWALDMSVDTLERVGSLAMPTHVIWGSEDRLLPPPASQDLARAIPGSTLTCIEGAGHVPMVDAPDRFAAAVRAFLAPL